MEPTLQGERDRIAMLWNEEEKRLNGLRPNGVPRSVVTYHWHMLAKRGVDWMLYDIRKPGAALFVRMVV